MQFIFTLLKKVAAGMDANKAAKEAYAETLSQYHNFVVKGTFDMGLMAAPSTETMLPLLGSDKVRTILEFRSLVQNSYFLNRRRRRRCRKCRSG